VDFSKLEQIGVGTYGVVHKAIDKNSGITYALKQVKMHELSNEGFPLTSLREISLLKQLEHPNIIKLHDVVVGYK